MSYHCRFGFLEVCSCSSIWYMWKCTTDYLNRCQRECSVCLFSMLGSCFLLQKQIDLGHGSYYFLPKNKDHDLVDNDGPLYPTLKSSSGILRKWNVSKLYEYCKIKTNYSARLVNHCAPVWCLIYSAICTGADSNGHTRGVISFQWNRVAPIWKIFCFSLH